MKFAQLLPGVVIDAGSHKISRTELLRFAKAWDPQPFHINPHAAHRSKWGGLIASGWHTCSIAMRLAAVNVLEGSESIGSPGVDELRWEAPVRPDDELSLTIRVISARQSSSKRYGIVRWQWEMTNQDHVRVLSLVATSFFSVGVAPRTT